MGLKSNFKKFNAVLILFMITFSLLIPLLPTISLLNTSGLNGVANPDNGLILEKKSAESVLYSGNGDPIEVSAYYDRNGMENNINSTENFEFFSNNWNITFTNFTLYNLTALEQSIMIQDFTGSDNFFVNTNGTTYYMEFQITNSCYVDKIYLHAKGNWTQTSLTIWNATSDSGTKPDELLYLQNIDTPTSPISTGQWLTYDIPYFQINTDETFNNSFFIAINSTTPMFSQGFEWEYYMDSKDGDQGDAYYSTDQVSFTPQSIDLISNVSVKPLSYYPDPEKINFTINEMDVNDTASATISKNSLNFTTHEVINGTATGSLATFYNVTPSDINNYTQIDYYFKIKDYDMCASQISSLNLSFGVFLNFTIGNMTQTNYSIFDKDDFAAATILGGFNTTDSTNVVNINLDSNNITNYVNKSSFIKISLNATSELQNYSICMTNIHANVTYQPSVGNWAPNMGIGNWLPTDATNTVYNVSSNWPVQFNLSWNLKYDFNTEVISTFEGNSSESTINWNSTLSSFNFNEDASNKQINFTECLCLNKCKSGGNQTY